MNDGPQKKSSMKETRFLEESTQRLKNSIISVKQIFEETNNVNIIIEIISNRVLPRK